MRLALLNGLPRKDVIGHQTQRCVELVIELVEALSVIRRDGLFLLGEVGAQFFNPFRLITGPQTEEFRVLATA